MAKLEQKLGALGLASALAFGNGCSVAIRYTPSERAWFGASVAANTADVATTIYGLNNGLREGHPLLGDNPSTEKLILLKAGYLGLAYGLGEISPEHRKSVYKVTTGIGAFATTWNLAQILFNSHKKE